MSTRIWQSQNAQSADKKRGPMLVYTLKDSALVLETEDVSQARLSFTRWKMTDEPLA